MKTILVPTDFSECAEHALNYACFIAEKTNSKIILLHVLHQEEIETSFSSEGEWMGGAWAGEHSDIAAPSMMGVLKMTKKKMGRILDLPQCKKVSMTDVVEIGNVSAMISRAVKKYNAEMIVMGTHGTSGLNEIFIGSNTEHVVRNAEIPVLAVKEGNEPFKINSIAFATDFSEETDLVFPAIKEFADIFNAKVTLVKILPGPNRKEQADIKNQAKRMKEEDPEKNYKASFYYHDQKETGIRHFADAIDADLIALGTHGRHGLARFFKGSIAENLVNHSPLPVLTINFQKKLLGKKSYGRKVNVEEQMAESIIPETFYSGHVPSI